MSLLSRIWQKTGLDRSTWRMSLLLMVALFCTNHELSRALNTLDGDYNSSQDDIVAGVSEGSPARQVALIVLAAFGVGSLLRSDIGRALSLQGTLSYLLLGFVAWASLSCLWSEDPALTVKRLGGFLILSTVAVVVSLRFSVHNLILWIFYTTGIFLIVAIAAETAYGVFHPFSFGYRFAGTQHPNGEGMECGLLFLSGIAAAGLNKEQRRFRLGAAFAGLVFLLFTGSRTSLIATFLGLAIYLVVLCSKAVKSMAIPAVAILLAILLFSVGAQLLPGHALSLGRDDEDSKDVGTFTGRTVIWGDVMPSVRQSPLLGHGYAAYWTPEHIRQISEREQWGVPDSHSTYFDYLLTLGVPGLLLYLLCLLAGIWRALQISRVRRDASSGFVAGLLVVGLVHGFFESAMGEGSLLMFLCIVVLTQMAFVPLRQVFALPVPSQRQELCRA